MTNVYDESDLYSETRIKKKMMRIWWILFGIVTAITLTIFIIYTQQGYKTPLRTPLYLANIFIVIAFAVPSFGFFILKYSRQRAYVKMLKYIETGLKEESTFEFVGFVEKDVKEKVEFIPFYSMQYNALRNIYYERKVLCDLEKALPPFQKGDIVHVQTQGNILIAYEVLPRPEDEPTLTAKYDRMAIKDKELLHDSVIVDEATIAKLSKKRRGKKQ